MKQFIGNPKKALLLALCSVCVLLLSFTSRRGGDSFEIFLNNKLVHKQFVYGDKAIHTLTLESAKPGDQLKISYSHCGRLGVDRTMIIRDAKNKDLKQWNYANGTATSKYLTCKMKEIMDLQKDNNTLQLVYLSKELPEGLVLAKIKRSDAIARK